MTTAKWISAKATSLAVACDDYDVTTKTQSQTKSCDIDNSHDHDHDNTNLTQVSSTNTIHSDLTIRPNTNATNMEGRSSNNDSMATQPQIQTQRTRPRTKESQKSRSRASSTSQRAHTRSTSSSTAGNSTGQRPGPSRRTTSQTVQQQMSVQKREQLIALHRESCRLFQGPNVSAVDRPDTRSMASPTASPTLQSQRSHSFPLGYDHDISDEDLLPSSPNRHQPKLPRSQTSDGITSIAQISSNQVMVPATITEWTSPSTRRREYEKIDRNNKGFRRLWRRWTPSCMHAGDERVPFFEEEISKKKNYEGSVRRFRMDIPDDEQVDHQIEEEKGMQISTKGMVAGPKVEKGRWSCF